MKKVKIGFIGAGNMGEALIRGLLRSRLVSARDICFSDPDPKRRAAVRKAYRVKSIEENASLAEKSDVIFLAVKPMHLPGVLEEVGPSLDRSKLLISIAAGVPLRQIAAHLVSPVRLVRAMPNTPALVGAGASAICHGPLVTAGDRRLLRRLFGAVGETVEVEEKLMDAVTGLSGSGPAYVFSMIQGLADGGVLAGLPRAAALRLAAQTVLGAASMVIETGASPIALRDQVASPGGTTIRGLEVLERGGFQGTVMAAVQAAAARSRQLSEK